MYKPMELYRDSFALILRHLRCNDAVSLDRDACDTIMKPKVYLVRLRLRMSCPYRADSLSDDNLSDQEIVPTQWLD